jgi:hypothetical protein
MESGSVAPLILNLDTAYVSIVTIILLAIRLEKKKSYSQHPLKRRLGGPQTRSAYFGEQKIIFSTPANRNLVVQHMAILINGTVIL